MLFHMNGKYATEERTHSRIASTNNGEEKPQDI